MGTKRRKGSLFDAPSLPSGLRAKLLSRVRAKVARSGWPVSRWEIDAGYQYDEHDFIVEGYLALRASGYFMGRRFMVLQVTTPEVIRDRRAPLVIAPLLAQQAIEFLDANA